MPPDPPRGSGLQPSLLQGTWLLTSQCPSTSEVNENPGLPVCFRIEFKLLILTFKAIHGLAPQYITDLITIKQQFGHMMLRSQSELQLLPPGTITKRTLGDRSFMASAPKLWNRLPSNIRAVNDLNCFKTLLKTHLFRQAFSCLLL